MITAVAPVTINMTPAQQELAFALMATGLSERGYRQARQIISLEIIDLTSGATLRAGNLAGAGPFQAVASFTVPSNGAFLVRVRGTWTLGDGVGTAPYEFFVKRGP